MNCNKRFSAAAMLAAASLTFSTSAWSLGLGDATVESYLNQPLKVRIDLISQASDDLESVTARLASAADYELIGASRDAVSVPVRFSIEDIEGDAYISATSNLPIGDPVLRLIVEVNWSSGRMLREYTLFLDPPTVAAEAPAPRINQRTSAAPPAPMAEARPATAAQPEAAAATTATAAPSAAPSAAAEYGPVRSGETLWGIANDWSRGSGLNVNQVMIAIQRENPQAFMNDNINLLKRGAILRMPVVSDVEQIPAAAAYREVMRQEQALSSGREAASVASPATPLMADDRAAVAVEDEPGAAQEPDAAAAEPPAAIEDEQALADDGPSAAEPTAESADTLAAAAQQAADEESQDLLELVPPSGDSELDSNYGFEEADESGGADVGVQSLRENLARTEEELINQQQQNTYLEERIQELEAELEAANQAQVPDPDLASMEDRLREQRVAEAQAAERSEPWYSHLSVWLVGLLVMIAAFAGWLISRRGRASAQEAAAEESLRSIQDEAEDVLRVLADEPGAKEPATEKAAEIEPVTESAGADEPEKAVTDEGAAEGKGEAEPVKPAPPPASEDAELLDEESSDPEIQLDLARAYISMGDKEAARVILEEVLSHGSEAQQSEAQKMLDLLA